MTRFRLMAAALCAITLALAAPAEAPPFDYYMLSLSWAPDFCALPGGNKDPKECSPGRRLGFVVHGLWQQMEQGRAKDDCGSSPVAESLVGVMLRYIPTESLIQHEWKTHGSCSGLSSQDYFALVRKARDGVKIPASLTSISAEESQDAAQIESQFAAANPTYPKDAFRATCYREGTLQEVRICFDKDLKARACTNSAGGCRTGAMKILPPR